MFLLIFSFFSSFFIISYSLLMDSECHPFTIFKPIVLVKHTYFKAVVISSLHPVTLKLLNLTWNQVMFQLVIYVLIFLNIGFIHVLLLFSVQVPLVCFVGAGCFAFLFLLHFVAFTLSNLINLPLFFPTPQVFRPT